MKFAICSPCYNAGRFVRDSVLSALQQSEQDYRIFWLNDGSTDDSAAEMGMAVSMWRHTKAKEVTVVKNDRRRGAVFNYYHLAQRLDPDEIMVFLDADDQLAHPAVLSRLASFYQDPATWVTWGQFAYDPVSGGGMGMAAPLPLDNWNRNAGWRVTHLKTCYAGLVQAIKEEDLIDSRTGDFWATAGDLAFFWPPVEMAGPKHGRFIPEVLYLYNLQNPINDVKVDAKGQWDAARILQARPPYPVLERLPWQRSSS